MFDLTEINECGVFAVNLSVNGKKINVVLDDYFPVLNGVPAFSRGNGPELWVLILEKAFAKVYGSYERIEWGFCHQTQRDLTGAPGHNYDLNKLEDDKLLQMLKEAETKNYICTTSVGGGDDDVGAAELK
jgi:calpain-15